VVPSTQELQVAESGGGLHSRIRSRFTDPYTITLDDDPTVRLLIERTLRTKSLPFVSAKALLQQASRFQPVAVFVDIHLSLDESGLEVLPTLRANWPYTPLLVITSDLGDTAISEALALGADDFLRKPLQGGELIARLQARFWARALLQDRHRLTIGDLTIDRFHNVVAGPLGKRSCSMAVINLIACLAETKGILVPRDTVKQHVWGQIKVSNNALDRKISEARSLLTDTTRTVSIRTVYGLGFSLEMSNGKV